MKTLSDLLSDLPREELTQMSATIRVRIDELLVEKRIVDQALLKKSRGGRPRKAPAVPPLGEPSGDRATRVEQLSHELEPDETAAANGSASNGSTHRATRGYFVGKVSGTQIVELVGRRAIPMTHFDVQKAFASEGIEVSPESMRVAIRRLVTAGRLVRLEGGRVVPPETGKSDELLRVGQTSEIQESRHTSRG